MLPISLSIEGLASYQEKQTIEFDNLLSNHIFGIFGDVGSGKSSILDAITFALYGELDKIDRNHRHYNMMNLKSNTLHIEYVFKSGGTLYRFSAHGKRNSKNFEDVTIKRSRQELTNSGWIATEKSAEDIIGLSYDNFKRTIIIPQGKFTEFLSLGNTDRTKMLKEIFHLEKYDLAGKTKILETKVKETEAGISGELKGYTEVTEKNIFEKKEERKTTEKETEQVEKTYRDNQKNLDELETLSKSFKELGDAEQKLKDLEANDKAIEELSAKIKSHRDSSKKFQLLITEKERAEKDLEELTEKHKNSSEERKQANEFVAKADTEKTKLSDSKKPLEEKITTNKKLIQKFELYTELMTWVKAKQDKKKDIETVTKNIETEQNKIDNLSKSFDYSALDKTGISPKGNENLVEEITEKQKVFAEGIIQLNKERDELVSKKGLNQYAQKLAENPDEKCPLCGSNHHPEPMEVVDFEQKIVEVEGRIQNGERINQSLESFKTSYTIFSNDIANHQTNISQHKKNLDVKQTELTELNKQPKYLDYQSHSAEQISEEYNKIKKAKTEDEKVQEELKTIEKYIQDLTTSLATKKGTIEQLDKVISDFEKEIENNKAELEEKETELKKLLQENKLTLEEVLAHIAFDGDTDENNQRIENHKTQKTKTTAHIDSLKKDTEGKELAIEDIEKLKVDTAKTKEVLDNHLKSLGNLNGVIKNLEKDIERKTELEKDLEVASKKLENLDVLKKMFKGQGFVNYVSIVFLNQILESANARFMKLSQNSLSLSLNKDNSFDVIDYLNNGQKRSAKTLSGGQKFQASFSLALALASSVQQLNKNDENFFFLDEGFGTQDPKSLNLVFETLRGLRSENKKVGIISHVPELKEQINVYLDVEQEEVSGSKIIPSWKRGKRSSLVWG